MADSCSSTVVIKPPGGPEVEVPVEDLFPVDEVWEETSRQTEPVSVSGVIIDRIVSVTFRRPGGGTVTLAFDNP